MIYTFKIKLDTEIEIQSHSEENAWEQLEEYINTEHFEKNIELLRVDGSDEQEAKERARDRYEALQEDRAVEMARGII